MIQNRLRLLRLFGGLLLIGAPVGAYGKPSVKELTDALVSGKPHDQLSAMAELARGGQPAVNSLCDVVENSVDHNAKERATQTLEKALENLSNRSPEVLERLGRMLANRERKVVESAARAVMQFKGNSRARDLLRRASLKAKDDDTTTTLLGAVLTAANGDKSEIPFFEGFLKHDSKSVRIWAAGYLGVLGSRAGLDECNQILSQSPTTDKIRTMQMRAAIAAGRIGDPVLIPQLERVGGSENYGIAARPAREAIREIRLAQFSTPAQRIEYFSVALRDDDSARWAATKLMAIGDANALTVLEWASQNLSGSGRYEAKRALAVLKGAQ